MIDDDITRARELARMDDWSDAESADAQRVLCVLLGILDAQDARIGPSIHDDPVAIAKRWLGEGRREPDFDANPEDTASFLASHVLRTAPVVAAAKMWRAAIAKLPRPTDADVALASVIDRESP